MTYEKFNEARDLHEKMEYLLELEDVISNAGEEKLIACIQDVSSDVPLTDNHYKICKINNSMPLTPEMRERFLEIIREEHDRIYKEFQEL